MHVGGGVKGQVCLWEEELKDKNACGRRS